MPAQAFLCPTEPRVITPATPMEIYRSVGGWEFASNFTGQKNRKFYSGVPMGLPMNDKKENGLLSQSQVKPHTFAYAQVGVPKNPATMLGSFCSRCITRSTLALSSCLV